MFCLVAIKSDITRFFRFLKTLLQILPAPRTAVPPLAPAKSLLSPTSPSVVPINPRPPQCRPLSHNDLLAEERMDKMHRWGKPINKRPPKKNPTGVQGRPYARSALDFLLLNAARLTQVNGQWT